MEDPHKHYEAWKTQSHSEVYDKRKAYTNEAFIARLNSGHDVKLLNAYIDDPQREISVTEIGCATGDMYFYLQDRYPDLRYCGFDISDAAIEKAREKYPQASFYTTDFELYNVREMPCGREIIFCRDVVLHQPDPYKLLGMLLALTEKSLVLRLRTRDRGDTVFDPARSRQENYGKWVPNIALNIDELIEYIKGKLDFKVLHIARKYKVLDGEDRVVPEDWHYPETGTANTAIYIERYCDEGEKGKIILEPSKGLRRRVREKMVSLAYKIRGPNK